MSFVCWSSNKMSVTLFIWTTTWCQKWDNKSRNQVGSLSSFNVYPPFVLVLHSTRSPRNATSQADIMAALAGLPIPRMDWSSTDAPQALKKFKSLCQLYFAGPLKDKSEEEQVSYLLIWSGEEGIELVSTWSLTTNEKKKLITYWEKFEDFVVPRSNFRLARYKLCTLQTPHPEAGSWRISRFICKESTDFSKRVQVHKPRWTYYRRSYLRIEQSARSVKTPRVWCQSDT